MRTLISNPPSSNDSRLPVLASALLVPPALLELALAAVLPATFYLGYALLGGGLLWLYGGRARPRKGATYAALLCIGLLALFAIPWTSRKTFLGYFRQVEPGMSVEVLDQKLSAYEFHEARAQPGGVSTRSYRHRSEGRFDADIGVVQLRDGKVLATEFLPD